MRLHQLPRPNYAEIGAATSGLGRSSSILDSLMQIGHADRRKTRYVRLRKAIANGLAEPDGLKGTRKPVVETEAVDPELDAVAKRLMRRVRL